MKNTFYPKSTIASLIVCLFFALTSNAQSWQWECQNLGKQYFFKSIFFLDSTHGFVCGLDTSRDKGVLFKTSDGGDSWVKVQEYTNGIYDIHFTSLTVGHFAADSGYYFTSHDGGLSIKYKHSAHPTHRYPIFHRIRFWDDSVGIICSEYGVDFKTFNGGKDWLTSSRGNFGYARIDGQMLNDSTYITIGNDTFSGFRQYRGRIVYKLNNGPGWLTSPSFQTFVPNGMSFYNLQYGVVVGYKGEIFYTRNLGTTLIPASSPTTKILRSVLMLSEGVGWAVGDSGLILNSTDSGKTWHSDTVLGNFALTRILSIDNIHFTCGDMGSICRRAKISAPSSVHKLSEYLDSKATVVIYPNPTNHLLTVTWNMKEEQDAFELRITNLQGKMVLNQVVTEKTGKQSIAVDHLAAGLYLFQALKDGRAFHVEKLVVEF